MKLFLATTGSQRDGYQTVSSFENFRYLAERINLFEEIRVESFSLGLSCIYWIVDNYRDYLRKIKFVINLQNAKDSKMLKDLVMTDRKKRR